MRKVRIFDTLTRFIFANFSVNIKKPREKRVAFLFHLIQGMKTAPLLSHYLIYSLTVPLNRSL